jgi:hypothetical protein
MFPMLLGLTIIVPHDAIKHPLFLAYLIFLSPAEECRGDSLFLPAFWSYGL